MCVDFSLPEKQKGSVLSSRTVMDAKNCFIDSCGIPSETKDGLQMDD